MTPEEEEAFEFEFDIEYQLTESNNAMKLADKLKLQYPGKEAIIEKCLFNLVVESVCDMIPRSEVQKQELSDSAKKLLDKTMDRIREIKQKRKDESDEINP